MLLVGWQEGHPACKKLEWWDACMVICLERGADLHMTQLMPLPLTVSCFSKIQVGLPFWYRLTWVVPEKGQLNVCRICSHFGLHLFFCWSTDDIWVSSFLVYLCMLVFQNSENEKSDHWTEELLTLMWILLVTANLLVLCIHLLLVILYESTVVL